MKTPSTAALAAHLAEARLLVHADLYAITLPGGPVLRYTSRGQDVIADGMTWQGGYPLMRRTGTRRATGIEVSTVTLTVQYRDGDMLGTVPWSSAMRGVMEGAEVAIRRAYFSTIDQPAIGTLHVFDGHVSDIEGGDRELTITLRSVLDMLDQRVPRSLYQAGCRNTVYDPLTCKAARQDIACVSGAGATRVRMATGLPQADAWFTGGLIRGVSGANAGIARGVKLHQQSGGVLIVGEPWPAAPAAGDQFLVAAGCDRTRDTCRLKFNNAANYRGEPYTPSPETTL